MTATSVAPVPMRAADSAPRLDWAFVAGELWVATTNGAFAGTVDPQGEHFIARNRFAQYLGDFPALETAREKVRSAGERRGA